MAKQNKIRFKNKLNKPINSDNDLPNIQYYLIDDTNKPDDFDDGYFETASGVGFRFVNNDVQKRIFGLNTSPVDIDEEYTKADNKEIALELDILGTKFTLGYLNQNGHIYTITNGLSGLTLDNYPITLPGEKVYLLAPDKSSPTSSYEPSWRKGWFIADRKSDGSYQISVYKNYSIGEQAIRLIPLQPIEYIDYQKGDKAMSYTVGLSTPTQPIDSVKLNINELKDPGAPLTVFKSPFIDKNGDPIIALIAKKGTDPDKKEKFLNDLLFSSSSTESKGYLTDYSDIKTTTEVEIFGYDKLNFAVNSQLNPTEVIPIDPALIKKTGIISQVTGAISGWFPYNMAPFGKYTGWNSPKVSGYGNVYRSNSLGQSRYAGLVKLETGSSNPDSTEFLYQHQYDPSTMFDIRDGGLGPMTYVCSKDSAQQTTAFFFGRYSNSAIETINSLNTNDTIYFDSEVKENLIIAIYPNAPGSNIYEVVFKASRGDTSTKWEGSNRASGDRLTNGYNLTCFSNNIGYFQLQFLVTSFDHDHSSDAEDANVLFIEIGTPLTGTVQVQDVVPRSLWDVDIEISNSKFTDTNPIYTKARYTSATKTLEILDSTVTLTTGYYSVGIVQPPKTQYMDYQDGDQAIEYIV